MARSTHITSTPAPINGTIKSGCLWFRLFRLLIRKPPVVVSCKSVSEINRQSIHLLAQWGSEIFISDINFANYKFGQIVSGFECESRETRDNIVLSGVPWNSLLMERWLSQYATVWAGFGWVEERKFTCPISFNGHQPVSATFAVRWRTK